MDSPAPRRARPWAWALLAGLLSGLPPFSLVNACFCPWALAAGFLAVRGEARGRFPPLSLREGLGIGARVAALTGLLTSLGTLGSWVFVNHVIPPDDSLGPFARVRPTLGEAVSEGAVYGLVWAVATFAAALLGALGATVAARRAADRLRGLEAPP